MSTPRRVQVVELHQAVAAPAGLVWDAAVDWATQGQWMLATSVQVTAGDGRSVGSRLSAYSGHRPLGFLDTMVITQWEPPFRCVVEHTGRIVRGLGVFTVEPRGGNESVFIWREELELPLGRLGALGWPLVRPAFLLGVRFSLRRFAAHCVSRADGSARPPREH